MEMHKYTGFLTKWFRCLGLKKKKNGQVFLLQSMAKYPKV